MACEFSRSIDFIDYLVAPRDEEWSEFRAHFPLCVDCTTTLSRLSAMEEDLTRVFTSTSVHPEPNTLLGFLDQNLSKADHTKVENHLESCADCRSELAAFRAVEVSLASATETPRVDADDGTASNWFERISSWLAMPTHLAPAFVILLLLGTTYLFVSRDSATNSPEVPNIAENPMPPTPRSPSGMIAPPQLAPPSSDFENDENIELAETAAPDPSNGTVPSSLDLPNSDSLQPAPEPANDSLLAESPSLPSSPQDSPEQRTDLEASEKEIVLLASLDPSMIPNGFPSYRARAASSLPFASTTSITRSAGPTQTSGNQLPEIAALAPRNAFGLTRTVKPTLYWYLEKPSRRTIEVTLTAIDGLEPVLSRTIAPPISSGLHTLSLEDDGVTLESGVAYQWEIAIIVDPMRRDRDQISRTQIGVIETPDLDRLLETRPAETVPHLLAEHGLWIDAFAATEDMARQLPDSDRVRLNLSALLDSAGYGEVGKQLER